MDNLGAWLSHRSHLERRKQSNTVGEKKMNKVKKMKKMKKMETQV